jgi:hypothetical protein
MFGDALRDILDPRLRGGAGRFSSKHAQKRLLKLEGAAPMPSQAPVQRD